MTDDIKNNNSSILDSIRKYLNQVKVPTQNDFIYKEECVYSFDTPESDTGLYINLSTFHGISYDYLELDNKKTGQCIYFHQKWIKVIDEEPKEETNENKTPTKLAIGGDGGFQLDQEKFHYDKEHKIIIYPSMESISYPNGDLPIGIQMSIDAILALDDASKRVQIEQWEEKRPISKYAENLIQLKNDYRISPNPKDWKCFESGMTENLWLNLSTGIIGSGRKNWDGTGGTGAALNHYNDTGKKYPLVVKLGTITPQGADVYSYADDENDMVEDPKLAEHLAHWGIDMMKMEKTDKTMAELDIELNLSYEFSKLTEANSMKIPLKGPEFIGLRNLGNSCYCNTVYQVLLSLDIFKNRFLNNADNIFKNILSSPPKDLNAQFAKLAIGLCTNRYEKQGFISPQMIKGLLGQNHFEFSTNRQQDAMEYYQHVLTCLYRYDKANNLLENDLSKYFTFEIESRIQCNSSKQVRYTLHEENCLSLNIPLEAALNKEAVSIYEQKLALGQVQKSDPPVTLEIPFDSVLQSFASPEIIDQFYSTATKSKGTASKSLRFKTFPTYLMIHLRRYILAENWTPKKLDATILLPENLSLESLRGNGLQQDETELPEDDNNNNSNELEPDNNMVNQLALMGFSINACSRAVLAVQNASIELATNWLMEHMGDADINDPLPSKSSNSSDININEESLALLLSMGIEASHARNGLKETGGSVERAVDWCFSHEPISDNNNSNSDNSKESKLPTGTGDYELKAIISHIGSNVGSGHYLCHIKKNGKWAIFNDKEVFESIEPPLGMGYLYLYQRKI